MERSSILLALYCGIILLAAINPPETIVTVAIALAMGIAYVALAIKDRS